MGAFLDALRAINPEPSARRWCYAPYDQLTDAIGPLAQTPPASQGLILIESAHKAARRPYHKQKLALILANQRHFALEQARRGVAIRYIFTDADYDAPLTALAAELGPITVMRPAERELRVTLAPLIARGDLVEVAHEGWLTSTADFITSQGKRKSWLMDAFYKHIRRSRGLLMDGKQPVGGKFSFDEDNRQRWRGEPPAPEPPRFTPDAITREVGALIEARYAHHPGALDLQALPATAADARALWAWALTHCLPHFGPYEDAMSVTSRALFHTLTSPLLHLHRLLPATLLQDVCDAELAMQSREGFIRQLIGWREFMRHVHEQTDGLRALPGERPSPPVCDSPGDAGYARWRGGEDAPAARAAGAPHDGGATPNALNATAPLPPAFWGTPSGLACLDHVVQGVLATGWCHHIERLMVLGNLATLLGVSPRELTDWFWATFIDAYDWVVEPNVLGMATFSLGDLFTTKPYVAGAAYTHRMSDYCQSCALSPGRDCPITPMYWAFLARQRDTLQDNPRVALMFKALDKRPQATRAADERIAQLSRKTLAAGARLTPALIEEAHDA